MYFRVFLPPPPLFLPSFFFNLNPSYGPLFYDVSYICAPHVRPREHVLKFWEIFVISGMLSGFKMIRSFLI